MGSIIKYLAWDYMYFAPKISKFRPNYTVSFQNKLILSTNKSNGKKICRKLCTYKNRENMRE